MSLILNNSVFLHVPKTGGKWVRLVCVKSGVIVKESKSRTGSESTEGVGRSVHCVPVWEETYANKPKFCFVRHPLDWYRSHWAFRTWKNNWQPSNRLDKNTSHRGFQEFIDHVIKFFGHTGYLSWLYGFYADHCSFVGRTEHIADDLGWALQMYEGINSYERIAPINITLPQKKEQAIYLPRQIKAIMTMEKDVLIKYGYGLEVPDLYRQ